MTFDVDDYLARIGRTETRAQTPATPRTLAALMRAHLFAIPFENLDPLAGQVPSLGLDDLAAKLVTGGRGGYCYEHNTLFAAVLRELGFDVTLLAGRVLAGVRAGAVRPRSHMLLSVHFPDEPAPYLADVGFGASGALLEPVPLVADVELDDAPRRHRLLREDGRGPLPWWTLQSSADGGWASLYTFTEEPFQAADFRMFNWYVATYPGSPFRTAPYVQRTGAERHLELSGTTLTERRVDGTRTVRELADPDELVRVLRTEFDIDVPARFAEAQKEK